MDYRDKLTIGIPVYNEQKYIAPAIESAVNQAGRIIIADNASTDRTAEICREYVEKYPHIDYYRHATNMGGAQNGCYLLSLVATEYFMYLGGHDLIPENYTRVLTNMLEEKNDAVLAYANPHYWQFDAMTDTVYDYFFHADLASHDVFKRLYALITHLEDCSLFHGIFRIKALKDALYYQPCAGLDHIILTKVAARGPFVFSPETEFYRRDMNVERTETEQAYIKRIAGETPGVGAYDCKQMAYSQVYIVSKIRTVNIFKKIFYVKKAAKILQKRFGVVFNFSEWLQSIALYKKYSEKGCLY